MEVQLDKRYPLDVSAEQAWRVLADIRTVAGCMPGAQITEQVDDTHYKGAVRSKVGPAAMSFSGDIEVLQLDAGQRRLEMLGKGVDRGGSSAAMQLAATIEPGATPAASVLVGVATVTVSGKLAQFGGRLLVPVADAMLAQFAANFGAAAAAVDVPAAAPETAGVAVPEAVVDAPAVAGPTMPAPRRADPAARGNELDALGLAWAVVKSWWAGLFGKKAA